MDFRFWCDSEATESAGTNQPASPDGAVVCLKNRGAQIGLAAKAIAWLEATWRHDDAAAFEKVTVPIRAINADKFPTDREANRRHAVSFSPAWLVLRSIKSRGLWPSKLHVRSLMKRPFARTSC